MWPHPSSAYSQNRLTWGKKACYFPWNNYTENSYPIILSSIYLGRKIWPLLVNGAHAWFWAPFSPHGCLISQTSTWTWEVAVVVIVVCSIWKVYSDLCSGDSTTRVTSLSSGSMVSLPCSHLQLMTSSSSSSIRCFLLPSPPLPRMLLLSCALISLCLLGFLWGFVVVDW